MEDERLDCIRHEQRRRMATRKEVSDKVHNDTSTESVIGRKFYLPDTVVGSPAHLRRLRCDGLELARRKGPPSFFVTATCSPHWLEIVVELLPGQTAADRPDIVVRAFRVRLLQLVDYS